MTRTGLIVTILATAVLSAGVTVLAGRILEDEPPVEGTVSATVQSSVLNEKREYFVHLPEGYELEATKKYPVIYVLDGTSQSGHIAASASLLARVGLAPPMIVVGVPSINGDTRNRDFTPPDMRLDTDDAASQKGAADRFLRHLEKELIPAVERGYRITRPRMLAGWSRGGLLVVYSLLSAPATFDARFAHSPALWRENNQIVGQLRKSLSTPGVPETFLFLSLGDRENEKMKAAFRQAMDVLEQRNPSPVRWRTYFSLRGTHENNPLKSAPVGLCMFFNPEQPCDASRSASTSSTN